MLLWNAWKSISCFFAVDTLYLPYNNVLKDQKRDGYCETGSGRQLSRDRKHLGYGDVRQDLPDNPKRFDVCACVLGREQFAGRSLIQGWVVGCVPNWGQGGISKASASSSTTLLVTTAPKRVGIFLDYEAGEVSFYNLTDRSHLFAFTSSFSDPLLPYFNLAINKGGAERNSPDHLPCPSLTLRSGQGQRWTQLGRFPPCWAKLVSHPPEEFPGFQLLPHGRGVALHWMPLGRGRV
ncbi:erythroid membrane-associated protein-like [Apteryx rowi]|uniref:erythroid membrane-associated protein-like n=1 Tax=Apteryx rowi TaxID=308060 RepID=UPI000E1D72CE|nr:erythroid membrane-associated protein-like [Apteryx rowi]